MLQVWFCRLVHVPGAGTLVVDSLERPEVGPGQFATQRGANWKSPVEGPNLAQVALIEACSELVRETLGQSTQKSPPVAGASGV